MLERVCSFVLFFSEFELNKVFCSWKTQLHKSPWFYYGEGHRGSACSHASEQDPWIGSGPVDGHIRMREMTEPATAKAVSRAESQPFRPCRAPERVDLVLESAVVLFKQNNKIAAFVLVPFVNTNILTDV